VAVFGDRLSQTESPAEGATLDLAGFFEKPGGTAIAHAARIHMPTVLFVSHDTDLRAVVSRVLTMAGCQVTAAAHSGHAALACIERGGFDVLLIEDRMADGTGGAIAGRLRRYSPGIQVVRMCDAPSAPLPDAITVVRPFTADDLIGAVSDATHDTRRGATIR
jgi:CheY-like chemotaxis protein